MLSRCAILNCAYVLRENYRMNIQIERRFHIRVVHVLNVYIFVHKCDYIFGMDTLRSVPGQMVHLKRDTIHWLSCTHFLNLTTPRILVLVLDLIWKKAPPNEIIYKIYNFIIVQTPWHRFLFFIWFLFEIFLLYFICKIFIFRFRFVHSLDAYIESFE